MPPINRQNIKANPRLALTTALGYRAALLDDGSIELTRLESR
jgi:hypothetical protein